MHSRKLTSAIFLTVLIAVSVASFAFQQEAQNKQKAHEDEPTVIQKGFMTEKQRRHSKEFEDREIPGIRTSTNKDTGVYIDIEPAPLPDKANATTPADYLRALTCAKTTDAVIVGKIVGKTSQLTENSRFVFTDYDIGVLDVLKSPIGHDSTINKTITITDAGGAVKLDGRTIFAVINRENPLRIGHHYILFLRRLTDSDSYRVIGERGIFAISQEKIKPTYYRFPAGFTYNDVVEQIRSIGLTCLSENWGNR